MFLVCSLSAMAVDAPLVWCGNMMAPRNRAKVSAVSRARRRGATARFGAWQAVWAAAISTYARCRRCGLGGI